MTCFNFFYTFSAWLGNENLKMWNILLPREGIQQQRLSHSHKMIVTLPPHRRGWQEQVLGMSGGSQNQDVGKKRCRESIITGDEAKLKSKGKDIMDECHTIKKQPEKVQHNPPFWILPCFFFFLFPFPPFWIFLPSYMVQDLRKKGSARRLILINSVLEDHKKKLSNVSVLGAATGRYRRSYLSGSSKDLISQDPNWSYPVGVE